MLTVIFCFINFPNCDIKQNVTRDTDRMYTFVK